LATADGIPPDDAERRVCRGDFGAILAGHGFDLEIGQPPDGDAAALAFNPVIDRDGWQHAEAFQTRAQNS
jgi:hypothetical protein